MNQITNGMGILINGDVHVVQEYKHVKPGKGGAFMKVKLKNLKTDMTVEKTLKSADRLEDVTLEEKRIEFLYSDGDSYHFMDHSSYEEMIISKKNLGTNVLKFLKDNLEVTALCQDHKVVKVDLPIFINFDITRTEPGVKGDSSRAGTKPATIETGTTVLVPLFVNTGDRVKIDTRTGQYVERVQK